MGRFSKHIMGGDEPMDSMAMLYELYGYKQYNKNGTKQRQIPVDVLERKQDEVYEKLKAKKDPDSATITDMQVWGVLLLNAGAKFLPHVKNKILEALELDEWAKQSLERKIYVSEMIEIIKRYDKLEKPVPTKEYEEYPEIPNENWANPTASSQILQLAVDKFSLYCKQFPLIKKVSGCLVNGYKYGLVILVDDSNQEEFKKFVLEKHDFEWNGIYDFQVTLIATSDFKVENGDKN